MTAVPALVTRREWSPARLHRAVAAGTVVPLLPGVYARRDLADDPVVRAEAVSRWNPQAIVCGAAAAQRTFWPELPVTTIDVAVATKIARPGYRFADRAIPPELCRYLGRLRLTAPAMTALDLAVPTSGTSIDRALRSRLVRIGDIEHALALMPRRRGNAAVSRLLLDSRAEPWSMPERMAHVALRDGGITGWRANLEVLVRGRRYFLDIAFPSIRLAIEIDGREFHIAPEVFETDRIRQNDLVLSGWTVLRYTYRRLVEDLPRVLDEIQEAITLATGRRR